MLDVSSGGGQVSGVDDTAQLISRVNNVKPVVTYTGSTMGAALWLGASANHTVAGKTAIVGSLGVIMVHWTVVVSWQMQVLNLQSFVRVLEKALADTLRASV